MQNRKWKYYKSFNEKYPVDSKSGDMLERVLKLGSNIKGNGLDVHHMSHCFDYRLSKTKDLTVKEHKELGQKYWGTYTINSVEEFDRFCATL